MSRFSLLNSLIIDHARVLWLFFRVPPAAESQLPLLAGREAYGQDGVIVTSVNMAETDSAPGEASEEKLVNAPFQYSSVLPEILAHLNVSLMISTYEAGKVLVIGVHELKLKISFLDFHQPMGIAVRSDRIAIGSKSEIRFMRACHAAASTVVPRDSFDGCYVAHTSRLPVELWRTIWAGGVTVCGW